MSVKSQEVAATIRSEIMRAVLPAGAKLRQKEIAERLGVSTTPVREALVALSREGLVLADDHRGVVVFDPGADDVGEQYIIRIELESLATERAVPLLTVVDLAALEAITTESSRAPEDQLPALDRTFHLRLYEVAAMPELLALIERLRDRTTACLHLMSLIPPLRARDAILDEHKRILEACRRGDVVAAVQLTAEHLERTAEAHHTTRRLKTREWLSRSSEDAGGSPQRRRRRFPHGTGR